MQEQNVTATPVEAQIDCAQLNPLPFAGMGAITHQPYFRPITRRELMTTVNTVARDLGLRAASVVVIDALLSCLPCKDQKSGRENPITPATLLTVFAANSTLCFRARGITDRQLRRHLERLEEIGLIQRRDSANGKRFPIQRNGRVIGAFGIDLSPLLARSEELCALADKRRAEAVELRGLRACIQRLQQDCQHLALSEELQEFVEASRNIMRRASTTLTQARALITQLTAILAQNTVPRARNDCVQHSAKETHETAANPKHQGVSETSESSATDGQNVRHKEPSNPYTKKISSTPIQEIWHGLATLHCFYPEPPDSEHGMLQIVYEFGRLLRMSQDTLSEAVATLGTRGTLIVQDHLAGKSESIRDFDAYAKRMIKGTGQVGHGQLLANPC